MALLHVGSGDVHGLMLCVVGVADTGQHISNRISDVHYEFPPNLELQAFACLGSEVSLII